MTKKQKLVNQAGVLLFSGYNIDDTHYIIDILNELSTTSAPPPILKQYKLGDSLLCMMQLHKTMNKLGNNKTCK